MTDPVRVLQLVAGLDIGRSVGGAELFALRLAQLVHSDRRRSAVFVFWRRETEIEAQWLAQLAAAQIPVYGLAAPTGRLPLDLARVARALWACVDHFRPQILNSHSERGDLLNLLVKALHPTHPRSVQTVHLDRQWGTQPAFGLLFNHLLAPLGFDRQVAVARTIQTMLDARPLPRLLGKRAQLFYNGIDRSRFVDAAQLDAQDAAAVHCPARVGVVGRLAEQKGHIYLLRALALVNQVLPVDAVVIGGGPLAEPLAAAATQLGIGERVHWLGRRDDVPALLASLDLLVSSSLWEGFPTVLLEAMAAGIPVIATDVSGSRELVQTGETGVLVPPGQPEPLAAAMIALLTNRPAARH
ncbi:MAG TPA: glycosyltransferase, partial [Caldilineaceae bacterium]|nr:glycosyltransferase [Caldilineaceae bacterium]